MKSKLITLLLLSIFLKSCTTIQKHDYSKFNNAYTNFIELATSEFGAKYGMAIAVVKDDRIIFERYQGMADVDKNIKVSENTLFYMASLTKSFTAMAALILKEEGKLDFDKSLAEFFPEIDFAPELKADKITIEHLIVHTSGIENNVIADLKSYTGSYTDENLPILLEKFTEVNTNAPFGEFEYTNIGYNILAMIMEKELGTDWKTLVEQKILQPLDMNQTSTRMSTAIEQGWEIARPHTQNNKEHKLARLSLEKKDNTMHSAGGIISTARDMVKWMRMELNKGEIDGKQIFDRNMVEKTQMNIAKQERTWGDLKRFAYGYGWNIATSPLGDTIIHHHGSFSGQHPQFSFNRDAGLGVVVMANEGEMSYQINNLLSAYVFDYFSGRKDIDTYYKGKLKEYHEYYVKATKSGNEYMTEVISKREWRLELPFSSYVGVYKSDLYGNLIVEQAGDSELLVTIGNLNFDIATAHRTNAIRVKTDKMGGSIIQFTLNKDKVETAIWKGFTFTK